MKGKDLYPRLLYPAKLSLRMQGQIKCFSDKVKLKEFIITKPLLCEMLKDRVPRNKPNQGGKRPVLRKLHNTEERN